jgi:hypothetical protein
MHQVGTGPPAASCSAAQKSTLAAVVSSSSVLADHILDARVEKADVDFFDVLCLGMQS